MSELEGSSKFTSILAEIRKLADEALELSEARRISERDLSDEVIKLSEQRRLVERADSDEALDVSESAFTISEKRRLTERDHSDQAYTLGEKRRTIEQTQSAEAFSLSKEQSDLEVLVAHQEIDKLNRQIIQILESMHETCLFFYNFHLIYVNTKAQTQFWPNQNIIGKTLGELLPKDVSDLFIHTYQSNTSPLSLVHLKSDKFQADKSFEFFFYPSESGFLVCFNDITKAKQIEKESNRIDNLNASKE